MKSSAPPPPTFTLRSLFMLIAIISLGLAIFVPLVRMGRDQARQSECMNNLKQIGLGLHNYHGTRGEIAPTYLTDDHSAAAAPRDFATWPLLILPFVESTDVYSNLDLGTPLNIEPAAPHIGHRTPNHTLVRSAMIHSFFCPARRETMLTRDGACATGDYAAVSRADLSPDVVPDEPRTWDAAMMVCAEFNTYYYSMTRFSDITDGLSYTAFIGEKAIHADRLGGDPSGAAKTQLPGQQDGTYYYGSGGNLANLKAPGAIAYWSRRLAPADAQESLLPQQPRTEDPNNRFGGWHGGVTLFLMGDASVRAVDHQVSSLVLQRLGCRNDGQSSELPLSAADDGWSKTD